MTPPPIKFDSSYSSPAPRGGPFSRRRRAARTIALAGASSVVILAVFAVDLNARLHDRLAAGPRAVDPLSTSALGAYLHTRAGTITAAVENLKTGHTWVLNGNDTEQTASIIKVDILETVLRQAQLANTPLSEADANVVRGMIVDSNDQDAQQLWNQLNGSQGVGAFNASASLTNTALNTNGYWGESTTTALDQIRLLRQLVLPRTLLGPASQSYELGLMQNVVPDQAWGVSDGVPSGVTVALKNGWVPLTSGTNWEINSVGSVSGLGRRYLIAVLTAHDPSEGYGIATIGGISKLVWRALS